MTGHADWQLGLAYMAHALSRDLQRAARASGGPAALWEGSPSDLARWLRVGPDVAQRASACRVQFSAAHTRDALATAGVTHVGLGSPAYPSRLANIFDPPFGLFATGSTIAVLTEMERAPCVAIVGSRRPSGAGRRLAHDLAAALAQRGAVVVSGLARGIDGAAHEGALSVGGMTVGVLGSSVDLVHPRRHLGLAQRIGVRGAIVSEYWAGTTPAPWRFPARNRIVAGLADVVVVVEAAARSGALITADFAMEHGTPVLAVPGWPGAEMSAGSNALIRAGAGLCEGPDDVVNEVAHLAWRDPTMVPARDATTDAVLRVVAVAPCSADSIVLATGLAAGQVATALVILEIAGAVAREPGGLFRAVMRRGGT